MGDLGYGSKIGAPLGQKPEGLNTTIWERITSSVITAYPITITEVGGHYFPTEANIVRRNEYESGAYNEFSQKIVKSDITLSPDYEKLGAFKYAYDEVPDGTKVYFEDNRGISGVEYEWFRGKIRAKVDELFLDEVDNQIELLKSEIKAESNNDTHMEIAVPNELVEPSDLNGQLYTKKIQPEVVTEPDSAPLVSIILIGLFAIGVVGWMVFRAFRSKGAA